MKGRGVRETLNEVRWHPERDPSRTRIHLKDRTSPLGVRVLRGDEVGDLGPSSFIAGGKTIPYYKVFRITHGEEILFEREG